MQVPKQPAERIVGAFDSHAHGSEAVRWLCNFDPPGYACGDHMDPDTGLFQMVLQGPNFGIALMHWVTTLKWPQNIDHDDPQDWGISWFELTISFYPFTGKQFSICASGAGARSKYVDYESDEGVLLPNAKRNGAQQTLCFGNAIQNMQTLLGDSFFPSFKTSRCSSMCRLGWRNECAGIPRRPVIPNAHQTMKFIENYLSKLTGVRALALPIHQAGLIPTLQFEHVQENSIATRFQKYLVFMKRRHRGY